MLLAQVAFYTVKVFDFGHGINFLKVFNLMDAWQLGGGLGCF